MSDKSLPPNPPPMRKYKSFGWGERLINEWETVEWYTSIGKIYPYDIPHKNWFERLFTDEYDRLLEKSVRVNRELCREWPRS